MSNFCTKCGNQLEDNSSFCSNCGAAVNNTDYTPDTVASESSQNMSQETSSSYYNYDSSTYDSVSQTSTEQMQPKKNNNKLIIGIIAIVLCVVIVFGIFVAYSVIAHVDEDISGNVSQSWTDAYIQDDLRTGIANGKDYVEANIINNGRAGNVVIYATASQSNKIYTQHQSLYFNSGETRVVRFVFSETNIEYDVDYRMWIAE
jgi:hypothetical protein